MKKLLSFLSICLLAFSMASPAFAQDPEDDQEQATPPAGEEGEATPPAGEEGEVTPPAGEEGEATPPAGDEADTTDQAGDEGIISENPAVTTDDSGADLAETATSYPMGGTIGLIAAALGFILFFFKKKTSVE